MLLSLTIIAVVAAAALAYVHKVTEEPIAQAEADIQKKAIEKVLPKFDKLVNDTIRFTDTTTMKNDSVLCFKGYVNDSILTGIAIQAKDKNGFGGELVAMVGFDTTGKVNGYEILKSSETPGLGAKAGEWFQDSAKGIVKCERPEKGFKVKKDQDGTVDAITGSTITSRAFCRLVENAYAFYLQLNSKNDQQKGENE